LEDPPSTPKESLRNFVQVFIQEEIHIPLKKSSKKEVIAVLK
jgi:hypothetical protein